MLGFVFPAKDVTWRLNWYNELRMPILSAALLTDQGKLNLKKRMGELQELIIKNPMSTMELNCEKANVCSKEDLL